MRCLRTLWCSFVIAVALCSGCGGSSAADLVESPRDLRKFAPEAEAATATREQAIRDELSSHQNHPWAGEYYYGDGLGVNVRLLLAPESGFIFEWRGCMGIYDRNYGAVTHNGDLVTLHCEFENNRRGFRGIATSLRPVRWGGRHYLIADEQMIEFCNAVNSGLEAERTSRRFLIRTLDGRPITPPVTGRPELPEAYARLLLDHEIRGTVTAIGQTITRKVSGDTKFIDTTVTLDLGTDHGVFDGMELYVHETRFIQTATVTNAGPRTSIATVQRIDTPNPRPKVWWKVSSRFDRGGHVFAETP